MPLNKTQLKQKLDDLGVPYADDATNEVLAELLSKAEAKANDGEQSPENAGENAQNEQSDDVDVQIGDNDPENAQSDENEASDGSDEADEAGQDDQNQETEDTDESQDDGSDDGEKITDPTEKSEPPTPKGKVSGVGTPTRVSLAQAGGVKDVTKHWTEKAKAMKKHLDAQPKVDFYIPLSDTEKEGAHEVVQLNGYKFVIKKGVFVSLPKQVAEILADHYRITMEVGKDMRIDRKSDVIDALS